ncbi:MAG: aminoglycoside 6-adenylyltransferase [Mycobacterium leprae]
MADAKQQQAELRSAVRQLAQSDDRITAAAAYGSYTRGEDDDFSDVEFILYIRPDALAAFSAGFADWVRQVRPILLAYQSYVGNQWVVFDNLVRGEFDLMPDTKIGDLDDWPVEPIVDVARMVLLDKTGEGRLWAMAERLQERAATDKGPDPRALFSQLANEVWYHLLFVHNYLSRGDYWAGRYLLEGMVQNPLVRMVRIARGNLNGAFRWTPRGLESDLPPEVVDGFRAITCRYEPEEIRQAWCGTVAFAREICAATSWPYPSALAEQLAVIATNMPSRRLDDERNPSSYH